MGDKKQVIEIVLDDAQAQAAIAKLNANLQKAADTANLGGKGGSGGASTTSTGGGTTTSTGGGGSGGNTSSGHPSAGGSSGSTGDGSGGNSNSTGGGGNSRSTGSGAPVPSTGGGRSTPSTGGGGGSGAVQRQKEQIDAQRRGVFTHTVNSSIGAMGQPSPAAPFTMASGVLGGLGPAGVVAAGFAGLGGGAATARYESAMSLAGMEGGQLQGRTFGMNLDVRSPLVTRGAQLGYTPQESVGMLSGYGRSVGQVIPQNGESHLRNLFQAQLHGISPDALAAYHATSGQGGGSTRNLSQMSDLSLKATGTAQSQWGMRGAKVDELLQRMTAGITQMAEQGLRVDPKSLLEMASSLHNTSGSFAGMGGVRGAMNLSQMGPKAAGSFKAQFSGLADAFIMADAFSRTDNPLKAGKFMEETDPYKVKNKLHKGAGGDPLVEGLALWGSGNFSAEQSEVLGRSKLKHSTLTDKVPYKVADEYSRDLSTFNAKSKQRVLGAAANDPKLSHDLINIVTGIQTQLSTIASNTAGIVEVFSRWMNSR